MQEKYKDKCESIGPEIGKNKLLWMVGDTIEFTNTTTQEKMSCKVVNIYKYLDFAELFKHHSKISIGYTEDETANPDDMLSYYTKEDIENMVLLG